MVIKIKRKQHEISQQTNLIRMERSPIGQEIVLHQNPRNPNQTTRRTTKIILNPNKKKETNLRLHAVLQKTISTLQANKQPTNLSLTK